jgi:hypothetical protein
MANVDSTLGIYRYEYISVKAGLHVNQTAFDNASAICVCQPGPVALLRANVSGGNRREIDVRALPDFGRPRGFNILAAVAALRFRAIRHAPCEPVQHVGASLF